MGLLKTLTVNGTTYEVVPVVPAASITLRANAWVGNGTSYFQVVEVPGITPHTKIDLQPTSEQLEEFHYKVLAFVAENNNCVVTVYSVGDKPEGDHTIQITKTEVEGTGPIRGNTVGTTMPRPDWNQNDPNQADFIRNKPQVPVLDDAKVGTNVWSSQKITEEIANIDLSPGIVCQSSGKIITASDASNRTLAGLTIYGKTTQNGTPTPDSPVELETAGASGMIKTTVVGKNLLENTGKTVTTCGITFTVNKDGSVTANGTATDLAEFPVNRVSLLPDKRYILNGCPSGGGYGKYRLVYGDSNQDYPQDAGTGVSFSGASGLKSVMVQVFNGVTVNNLTFYPMIRFASVADNTYEPYNGGAVTASTPNGLAGIPLGATIPSVIKNSPIHMEGVWWDDKTQQYYISDTKDCARGVYVQRVTTKVYDGSADEFWSINASGTAATDTMFSGHIPHSQGLCSHYHSEVMYIGASLNVYDDTLTTIEEWRARLASSPMTVLYQLATPVETPLSAEEMAQYAALHTNKPNTTVYNDAGADMKLEYNADTKLYIDNKFNELATAIVNNT